MINYMRKNVLEKLKKKKTQYCYSHEPNDKHNYYRIENRKKYLVKRASSVHRNLCGRYNAIRKLK